MATHAIEALVTVSALVGAGMLVGTPLLPPGMESAVGPNDVQPKPALLEPLDLVELTHSVRWEQLDSEPAWPSF